jgi:hypothetical protein
LEVLKSVGPVEQLNIAIEWMPRDVFPNGSGGVSPLRTPVAMTAKDAMKAERIIRDNLASNDNVIEPACPARE